jgi:hypothetical protein
MERRSSVANGVPLKHKLLFIHFANVPLLLLLAKVTFLSSKPSEAAKGLIRTDKDW